MWYFLKNNFGDEFEHIKEGLRDFSSDKVNGVGALLSLFTGIAALVSFIVLVARFAVAGGYNDLMTKIVSFGGNAGSFYQNPIFPILVVLNIAMLVVAYISFFKKENWGFRILGLIPFVVCIGFIVAYYGMLFLFKLGKIGRLENPKTFLMSMTIGILVSVILSVALLLIREKTMSFSCLRLLVFSFGLMPLLTFCVENIAAMVLLVVLFVVLCVVFKSAGSGSEDGGSSSYGEAEPVREEAPKPTGGLTKEQQQAIYEINKKYKDGCKKICDSDPDYTGLMLTENCSRKIAELRKELEAEAERRDVKGKVSIY